MEGSCPDYGLQHRQQLFLRVLDNQDGVIIDQDERQQVRLIAGRGEIYSPDASCPQNIDLAIDVAHVVHDRQQVQVLSRVTR